MSNVTAIRALDPIRSARASFVKDAIDNDDRSVRYIAGRLGISATAMNDRVKGKVSFLAEDIEGIAHILKRDPVKFFADYLAASGPNSPLSD